MKIKMIQSEEDYRFYLEADRIALNIKRKRPRMFEDEVWKFQRLLRKVEYMENCGKNRLNQISLLRAKFDLRRLSARLGFTISRNVFGPGLSIAHRGSIVLDPQLKVGENCRIHHCVTIGAIPSVSVVRALERVTYPVPRIGNNVFIGPGAVIIGDIEIADGIAIGANSYVDKSFKEPNITVAGCPAKKVSDKGSEYLWLRATEILRARGANIAP